MLLSRNTRGKGSGVTIETVRECELANEIVVLALVRTTATLFLHERHMLVCERGCRGRQGLITPSRGGAPGKSGIREAGADVASRTRRIKPRRSEANEVGVNGAFAMPEEYTPGTLGPNRAQFGVTIEDRRRS